MSVSSLRDSMFKGKLSRHLRAGLSHAALRADFNVLAPFLLQLTADSSRYRASE